MLRCLESVRPKNLWWKFFRTKRSAYRMEENIIFILYENPLSPLVYYCKQIQAVISRSMSTLYCFEVLKFRKYYFYINYCKCHNVYVRYYFWKFKFLTISYRNHFSFWFIISKSFFIVLRCIEIKFKVNINSVMSVFKFRWAAE